MLNEVQPEIGELNLDFQVQPVYFQELRLIHDSSFGGQL
jgi:hypothetical protein